MRDAPQRLAALAAEQHDVFSRRQALEVGVSSSALGRHLAAERLQKVGTRTYAFGGFAVPWRGRLRAGLLDLGEGALVAGRAAACLHGLEGFEEGPLVYLVPRSLRQRSTPGVVRTTATLGRLDRTTVDGLACTSGTRTVLSMVGDASPRELERATHSALRDGLTSESVLQRQLEVLRHQGMTDVGHMDAVLATGAVQSWLEARFLELVLTAGLPEPVLQERHRLGRDRAARVDFAWPGTPVVVEVGGKRGYLTARERQRKEQRRNALQLRGKIVYFFSYEDVEEEPGLVVTTLARALSPLAS